MNEEKSDLNRYTCEACGQAIVTVDREKGVTPMMLRCRATRGCNGTMYSSMYRDVDGEPTYEWRKPTPEEYQHYSEEMRDHIDKGGLDIFPIEGTEAAKEPVNESPKPRMNRAQRRMLARRKPERVLAGR